MKKIKVSMTRTAFNKLMRAKDINSPKDVVRYLNATGGYLGRVVWIDIDEDPVYNDARFEVSA